jgi:PAS domain S-box-containing protein
MSVSPKTNHQESQRFEALFRYASIGILLVNGKGEIVMVNDFALKEFGYREEELVGKKIEQLIPQRFHKKHVSHREAYSKHPQARPMGADLELFATRKDGTEFPVEISLSQYNDGEDPFVIAFVSDITERTMAGAQIKKLNDELESTVEQRTSELTSAMNELERKREELTKALEKEKELSELKSRFVSMASHEFRTPLSTVLSSAYLVEKYQEKEEQPKRLKHLERIISSVRMLTNILDDFLSLGKIEEGKIQVRSLEFNIVDHVNSILKEMNNILKPGQSFKYRHEGEKIINQDPGLLKHIVMNLVSNAIKFSPPDSAIQISTRSGNETFQLSVKDQGIGISREDQEHLMERFFRAANATNIQGTGLGLHLISKYAELMNGKVKCISELEKGTEFDVTFQKLNT